MLIYVADYLRESYSGFNVFSYLTTRAILGALTALVLSFAFGPYLIQRLTMQRIGQQIRQVGPDPGERGHRLAAGEHLFRFFLHQFGTG